MTWTALARDQEQRICEEAKEKLRAALHEAQTDLDLAHMRIDELEAALEVARGEAERMAQR